MTTLGMSISAGGSGTTRTTISARNDSGTSTCRCSAIHRNTVGIGVNAGQVILGNMGAENRLDYTVIGAEVDLCARLCGGAEAGEVLVRADLLDGLDLPVEVRETRSLRFKNISEPLDIASICTRA